MEADRPSIVHTVNYWNPFVVEIWGYQVGTFVQLYHHPEIDASLEQPVCFCMAIAKSLRATDVPWFRQIKPICRVEQVSGLSCQK